MANIILLIATFASLSSVELASALSAMRTIGVDGSVLAAGSENSEAVTPLGKESFWGASALVKHVAKHSVEQAPIVETTNQNWFSKMGDGFVAVIVGIILIFFSIPCMIVNERQSARRESLNKIGESECSSVGPHAVDISKRGTLVHINEGNAQGVKAMQDRRFTAFHMQDGCLRMRTTVGAYQWVEHSETKETKDKLGGGTTKKTTYTYTKEWRDEEVNSQDFHDKAHQNRVACPALQLGVMTSTCELVHYGEAFVLPKDLVEQFHEFQDASKVVGAKATHEQNCFEKGDGYYFFPANRSGQPEIGDMRAKFEYILNGPATVVALQAQGTDAKGDVQRDQFLPYRMIRRGLCGIGEEEQKRRQLIEGAKDKSELYDDDKFSCGPLNAVFYCCLGMWNIVLFCFSALGPPQIYHLMHGKLSRRDCWKRIEAEASLQKWICRAVAWGMLLIGFMAIFQPIFTALEIVPLLGPAFSNILWFAVGLVALIATLAVAALVMSMAYLVYRPMIGLFYLVLAGIIVAVPLVISRIVNHGQQQ